MTVKRGASLLVLAAAIAAPAAADAASPSGRYQVVLERPAVARSASALDRLLDRFGLRRAGAGVPSLGVATVDGPAAGLRSLRRDPAVKAVSAEWRRDFRRVPSDPAIGQQDPDAPAGTPFGWYLQREGFPHAWDITTGQGALVGVLDSGIDGGHPELAGKIATGDEFGSSSGAFSDQDGHGTHVSGLACAATDNGAGVAGAGWGCRLVVVKVPNLLDQDIAAGIKRAADRGADAINMSFGGGPPNAGLSEAIEYAYSKGVVLVAAASNTVDTDQGAPASQLQPGDGANIDAGRGLVVTGADASEGNAATGRGGQISLAAYGFFDGIAPYTGPLGLLSTYPGNGTPREFGGALLGCGCRVTFGGDNRYAELEGTSMSAPQVAAAAALVGNLNPDLSAQEKLRILKQTARRSGGWTPDLGWGILDAGAAMDAARRVDRHAPDARARVARRVRMRRRARTVRVRVRLSRADRPGHIGLIPSGVRSIDVYLKRNRGRYRRVVRATRRRSVVIRLRPGTYRLYARARDNAGNVERRPRRADARTVVSRRR